MKGGSFSNPDNPVTYTDEQIKTIQDNPFLKFVQKGKNINTGHIFYPNTTSDTVISGLSAETKAYYNKELSNARLVECLLMDLCDWYNKARTLPHDPYQLAAELQRRLVVIHPFRDANGRTSRLLMDWSLENDCQTPAILFDPNDDILTSADKWAKEVQYGSDLYHTINEKRKRLVQVGYENTAELMGLSAVKTFYDLIFSKLQKAPAEPSEGKLFDQNTYTEFIDKLQKEYGQFLADFFNVGPSSITDVTIGCPQGGLIPRFFIDFATLVPKDAVACHRYARDYFYGDTIVYRGGLVLNKISSEQDVLKLFEEYIGAGSSYLTAKNANISSVSADIVPPEYIARSLEVYNDLLTNAYFRKYHPELANNINLDLVKIIGVHILGSGPNISNSPFVSTSLAKSTAEIWSRNNNEIPNAQSGILITAHAPNFGGILTFGTTGGDSDLPGLAGQNFIHPSEKELVIAGAINPTDIISVKVNSIKMVKGERKVTLIWEAEKKVNDDGISVEIKNCATGEVTIHKLDPLKNHYVLSENKRKWPFLTRLSRVFKN
jgi:hypothetical protein